MLLTGLTRVWALTALLGPAAAWPGMNKTLNDLLSRGPDDSDSHELIGDLLTLPESDLTPVAQSIRNILTGAESGQSTETWQGVLPPKDSAACRADTCCIWAYIAQAMAAMFQGGAGRCNGFARASVRVAFHDAAGWSKSTGGGGADGSIVLSEVELSRPENRGLQEIAGVIRGLYAEYRPFAAITYADLIQMASTVATVTCPLGPRVRSFVGRRDNATPAPPGLIPNVHSDADTLIALFRDKTIGPRGLAALLGAHTTSQQFFVDPARAGDPQDSTPGVWDTLYYWQTVGPAPPRVFRFPSDVKLAVDPRISGDWRVFGSDQRIWNEVSRYPHKPYALS